MISKLTLKNIGPSEDLDFEFAPRINILTGDNGLGKSFVLECLWWVLTGTWTAKPVRPEPEAQGSAEMTFCLSEEFDSKSPDSTSVYDSENGRWQSERGNRPKDDGLVIYARVDGGFSISFSRHAYRGRPKQPFILKPEDVWDGTQKSGKGRLEGFYRDVVSWLQTDAPQAHTLRSMTAMLSPQSEKLEFTTPKRVYLDDPKHHPILRLPYGDVPIAEASAGMRRILALAYIVTWAHHEDVERSKLLSRPASQKRTLILDEVESHLHPEWQRTIIPSILKATSSMRNDGGLSSFQFFLTTHSPLVLASIEPSFEEDRDRLFHFDLKDNKAIVRPIKWAARGNAAYWLTSPVFGLKEARSIEAEVAIRAAKDFMVQRLDRLPENLRTKEAIHAELKRTLPGQDLFWPRWIVKTGQED